MAIKTTGFIPMRINKKEHNAEVSGEILYEISKSHFIVADVTGQKMDGGGLPFVVESFQEIADTV
ncbi:MAG: hypothetical protein LBQ88_19795 [Treponema sp.]|jgi:hypothetical protein|nr:hypothetical protein [Treponema sp.]